MSFDPENRDAAARQIDRDSLQRMFHASFDESLIQHLWQKEVLPLARKEESQRNASFSLGSPRVELLGAGLSFSAWALRFGDQETSPSKKSESPRMSLVLKIPHAETSERFGPTFKSWRQLIESSQRAVSLIPPFAFVESKHGFGLVMPLADQPLSAMKAHWLPFQQRLNECSSQLKKMGLELRDPLMEKSWERAQAGCWQGIPFLYDLSDLKSLRASL